MDICQKKTLTEDDLECQYGQTWIWAALDSTSRLIVCYCIGDRTLESSRQFLRQLKARLDNIPLFTSDELVHYATVLKEIYSEEIPVPKTGKRGRPKKAETKIFSDLDYAVVHKTREKGKVVKVEQRVVYGDQERIEEKIENGPGRTYLLYSVSKKIPNILTFCTLCS